MLKMITERVRFMPHDDNTDRPALGLISGSKYSLIVDAGISPKHAREFMSLVSEVNAAPARYVVITHYHEDHVFGIAEMNLPTIAHRKTREKIEEFQLMGWDDESLEERIKQGLKSRVYADCIKAEIPDRSQLVIENADIIFDHRLEVDLGDITCMIENIGGTHTEDSCLIYVPEEKVLFMGDCIYGRRFHGVYGFIKAELAEMVEKIKRYDAEHYLVSHLEPYTKEQMMELLDKLMAFADLVGDESSVEGVNRRYAEKYGKNPDEEAAFYIGCFANVNAILS